jgi:hypothetical protein
MRPGRGSETRASLLPSWVRYVVVLSVVVNASLVVVDLLMIVTASHVSAMVHGWIQVVLWLPMVTHVSMWHRIKHIADGQHASDRLDAGFSDGIDAVSADLFPNWLRVLSVISICLCVYFLLVALGAHVQGFATGWGMLQGAMILSVWSVWLLRQKLRYPQCGSAGRNP